jgi:membrane-associated phospholipid phosphatase
VSPSPRVWLRELDLRTTARLRALPARGITHSALSVIAHSGDSLILIPALALLWWVGHFARESIAVPLIIGYVDSVLLTTVVKYAVRRRRPEGEWGSLYRRTDPHSFPSGHAARTITLSLVFLGRHLVLAGVLLVVWSLAVGFARIVLGVHFLLDVLAGYLLGLAIGISLCFWMAQGLPGLPSFPW